MARKRRNYKLNTYYHLYNRGNRKQLVFYNSEDYQNFLDHIHYYGKKYDVLIRAYCLMPNHFHLIVKSNTEANNISKMMQSSMTNFCVYINQKYYLVGRSFQGTYKHREIEDIYDFNRLIRYLKQNPVRANMVVEGKYYRWLKT